jgi:ketosteroid isomerase-like protein
MPSPEDAVADLERAWIKAAIANDVAAMRRIIGDDWIGIAYNGQRITKADVLRDAAAGTAVTQSIDLEPMKVRVYGSIAIVNVVSTEKSTWQGQDTSGRYALVDVFAHRAGQWQVVSSQATKLERLGATAEAGC